MGLFSKLFGGDKEAEDALKKLKELADALNDGEKPSAAKPEQASQPAPQPALQAAPQEDEAPEGPSGESWGPKMPAEENQYNSGLSYREYFSRIFRENFPEYTVECAEMGYGSDGVRFEFFQGGRKALVVEVMSRKSNAKQQRAICRKQGIPYLRYYHNYDGWWNTKAYVISRTRKALL